MFENLLPVLVTFAEGTGGIIDVFQTFAGTVLDIARGIVLPIGIVGVIVCAIKIMISSDPQTVASTKRWLIYIVIGILIVTFAPAVLDQLKQLAEMGGGALNW